MSEEGNRMDSPQSQQQQIMYDNMNSNPISISRPDRQTPSEPPAGVVMKLKGRFQDFRAWLFFLTTLVATISYTAGLTPPGGFWSTDDKEKGYVAGTSVMRAMFPRRYHAFYYSNATAFFSSLLVTGLLGINVSASTTSILHKLQLKVLVGICFVSVGISFISGTWEGTAQGIYGLVLFVLVILYFSFLLFLYFKAGRM